MEKNVIKELTKKELSETFGGATVRYIYVNGEWIKIILKDDEK